MKAVRIHETGSPEVMRLEEVATPEAGEGEVLIRVAVAGVNFTDLMARQGMYVSRDAAARLPTVLGSEVGGVVVTVGTGVPDDLLGKRVVAFVHEGYAEFAAAHASMITELPAQIDLSQAVCCLVQGVTAWQVLMDCARLRNGESVLVHSAAGGVGTLAVQIARHRGASLVLATASSPPKLQLAMELGADVALDYTAPGWAEEVLAATCGSGVDVVMDAAGGDIGEQSVQCLAPFGRLVVYGVASKRLASFAGSQLMHKNQSVTGYWLTSRLLGQPEAVSGVVRTLLDLMGDGRVRGVIRHAFSLEQAAMAHRAVAERQTVGKVILMT